MDVKVASFQKRSSCSRLLAYMLHAQVKQLEADNLKSTTDVAWLREDLQAARERNVAFEKQVQALQPETQRLQGRIRDLEDTEESLRRELDCARTDADTYLKELGDERRHCHALRAKHKCRLQEEVRAQDSPFQP
eukprot:6197162-Pleurochrysis_carterae.AAC.2